MDKIVILANNPEDVELLRACYGMLFPECELQIIPKPIQSMEEAPVVGDLASSEKGIMSF
ncbi:hypothetical protein N9174_02040 [bacterium]|nr:hypothetical protein [bacterium]